MKMLKKGQVSLGQLVPIVVTLAVAVLVTSLIAGVIGDIRADQTANDADYNVSTQGLSGLTNLASQFPNIGTVIAIVIIVGLLVGAFAAFRA